MNLVIKISDEFAPELLRLLGKAGAVVSAPRDTRDALDEGLFVNDELAVDAPRVLKELDISKTALHYGCITGKYPMPFTPKGFSRRWTRSQWYEWKKKNNEEKRAGR